MLKRVDYDRALHAGYAKGRALLPITRENWVLAFRELAGPEPVRTIVDIGSGTGRFTPALADGFGARAIGVEPSERMRAIARTEAPHPAVAYRDGEAADIPLPDATADLALMFLVWHHVPDQPAAAREIARVLRPGARLLIATTFADRLKDLLLYRYFPRTRAIDLRQFPTVPELTGLFERAGFEPAGLVEVHHRSAESLADYVARQRLRALSVYEHLTDAEFETGLAAMEADAAAETEPRPVESECDLLALAKTCSPA